MKKTAFVFPGQGSQQVGMGQELYAAYPEAAAVFDAANHILDFDLAALCFDGPAETLNNTINAQPALLTASIAALHALQKEVGPLSPDFVAGHSMGEYSALVAAGSLTFAAGVRLVRERGRLMQAAGELNPGGMAAVLGLDAPAVAEVCASAGDVQIANDNAPGQVVISGTSAGIDRASELATAAGAKRVIRLAVSIAAHSELMMPIVDEFAAAVDSASITPPRSPIVGNISARPLADPAAIKDELVHQLTAPVHWVESVQYMVAQGADAFVEFGPGDVLSGLIRRIDRRTERVSVGDLNGIERFKELGRSDD
jgi:[acyl-carrier-protein] S-malonyltransferase